MATKTKIIGGHKYTLYTMGMGKRDASAIARQLRSHGYKARLGSKEGDGAYPVYARTSSC